MSDSVTPVAWGLPGSSVQGFLQARILEFAISFSGDLPDPQIKPRSPALQADSLPSEPLLKPMHTTVPPNLDLIKMSYTI